MQRARGRGHGSIDANAPQHHVRVQPDARFEFLHPADAGTTFARAVACEQSIGKTFYITSGASCRMTYYDFIEALMGAIAIGPIPVDAFVRSEPPRFFGDWVDTEESERMLQYQKRGLDEHLEDMQKEFGILLPLIRLVRPLATLFVVHSSAHLKGNRRATPQAHGSARDNAQASDG